MSVSGISPAINCRRIETLSTDSLSSRRWHSIRTSVLLPRTPARTATYAVRPVAIALKKTAITDRTICVPCDMRAPCPFHVRVAYHCGAMTDNMRQRWIAVSAIGLLPAQVGHSWGRGASESRWRLRLPGSTSTVPTALARVQGPSQPSPTAARTSPATVPLHLGHFMRCVPKIVLNVPGPQTDRSCPPYRSYRRPAFHTVDVQNILPPFGTLKSGFSSTTAPSSSGTPSVSTSLMAGPICRGGKFTTASTCRPIN
jgi:hypothetical protein